MEYIERLQTELHELAKRSANLTMFMDSEKFKALTVDEQVLLRSQKYTMLNYEDILKDRIILARQKEEANNG